MTGVSRGVLREITRRILANRAAARTESPVVGAAASYSGEQSRPLTSDALTSRPDSSSTTGPLTDRVTPFTLTENHEPAPRLTDAEYMVERRFRLGKNALDEK